MSAQRIPRTADDITAPWLSHVLKKDVTNANAVRIGAGAGFLSELYRVALEGVDVPESVVVKISTPNVEARGSATSFRMYEREIRFCQQLAPSSPVPVARVYGAEWDPETQDSFLAMQDLSEFRPGNQTQGLSVEDAAAGIDAMAAFHAHWWDDETLADLSWAGSLIEPTYYVGIPFGFEMLLPLAKQHFGHVLAPVMDVIEVLQPHINPLQDHLCRGPNTLLHGDFRGDNLLFGTSADHPPVALVDFQAVVVGRGEMDLAYFLGQSLTTQDRRVNERSLVERYVEALVSRDVAAVSFNACWEDYRRSMLYCLAYGVLMTGLDVTDEPTFAKVEMILGRLVAAAADLGVADLL